MKFFRHNVGAAADTFIRELEDEFGGLGYAWWFKLLELYYERIDSGTESLEDPDTNEREIWVSIHIGILRSYLRTTHSKIDRFFCFASEKGRVKFKKSEQTVELCIVKALKYQAAGYIEKQIKTKKRGNRDTSTSDAPSKGTDGARVIFDIWNENRGQMRECKVLNDTRRRSARKRWAEVLKREGSEEKAREFWKNLVTRLSKSAFCCGKNDREWVGNFDFLLRENTAIRALEGSYDTAAGKTHGANWV